MLALHDLSAIIKLNPDERLWSSNRRRNTDSWHMNYPLSLMITRLWSR